MVMSGIDDVLDELKDRGDDEDEVQHEDEDEDLSE